MEEQMWNVETIFAIVHPFPVDYSQYHNKYAYVHNLGCNSPCRPCKLMLLLIFAWLPARTITEKSLDNQYNCSIKSRRVTMFVFANALAALTTRIQPLLSSSAPRETSYGSCLKGHTRFFSWEQNEGRSSVDLFVSAASELPFSVPLWVFRCLCTLYMLCQ
jgi:hypothetical protein